MKQRYTVLYLKLQKQYFDYKRRELLKQISGESTKEKDGSLIKEACLKKILANRSLTLSEMFKTWKEYQFSPPRSKLSVNLKLVHTNRSLIKKLVHSWRYSSYYETEYQDIRSKEIKICLKSLHTHRLKKYCRPSLKVELSLEVK